MSDGRTWLLFCDHANYAHRAIHRGRRHDCDRRHPDSGRSRRPVHSSRQELTRFSLYSRQTMPETDFDYPLLAGLMAFLIVPAIAGLAAIGMIRKRRAEIPMIVLVGLIWLACLVAW